MIPSGYIKENNQNYHIARSLWKIRHDTQARILLRDAIRWIRADIAEFKRWGN